MMVICINVVKAQRADGYIHTPVIIDEKNKGIDTHAVANKQTVIGTKVGAENEKGAFANRLNFETYNLGHLMMAGIIHQRATGKNTLFDVLFAPHTIWEWLKCIAPPVIPAILNFRKI